MRGSCLGKTAKEKRFSVTIYRAEYERNAKRVNSKRGKYMKKKRQNVRKRMTKQNITEN